MIASLRGKIKDIFSDFLIIDVAGVGYKVEGINKYLEIGAEIDVLVYTHYTQQDVRLFGFLQKDAYTLFQDLLVVSGVGPRTAVALINNVGVENIKNEILNNNPKGLMGNGVGLKTAQKIIIELTSKIQKSGFKSSPSMQKQSENKDIIEVEEALLGLGYNKNEVAGVLADIKIIEKDSAETMLRKALNKLMIKK